MSERRTLAAFFGVVVLAGINPVAVRLSDAELAPFWGATIRFVAAGSIFWLLALVQRRPLPRGRAWSGAIAYGFFAFALFFTLIYWGLVQAHASTGAVALALVPLLTLVLAFAQRQEPFRIEGLVGAAVALIGIAIILGDQLTGSVSLAALLALVGAAASAGEAGIIIRWFPRGDPVVTNAIGMTVGVAILAALSLVTGEAWVLPTQPDTWLAFAYMVVLGSVGVFWLALRVLREWPATRASYQFLLMPLVTVLVAASLVGEIPSPTFLVGAVVVVAGVFIGVFWRRATSDRAALETGRGPVPTTAAAPAAAMRVSEQPPTTC